MTPDTLARRGARGGALVVSSQIVKLLLQAIGVVTLSRLLSPADFGLVAMVAVFIALGEILRDFGLPTAALQARELSRQQSSNLFWLNSLLGLSGATILATSAPLIAIMYGEPALLAVAPAMAVTLLLSGLQAQVQVQLARRMRYGVLAGTDVAAQSLGLVASVSVAVVGGGYWALVIQVLVASFSLLVLRAIFLGQSPSWPRRNAGTRPLVVSGAQLGFAMLLSYAADNADSLVIGVRWGPVSLGYYNRAFQLFAIPKAGILSALTQVVLPVVNSATSAGRAAVDVLMRVQFSLGFALTGIYLLLATGADWVIPLVLGAQWQNSIPIFQVLCVAGAISSFSNTTYWAFVAEHKSGLLLRLHLVTKPLIIISVVVGAQFGVIGAAVGYSVGAIVSWPISISWLARAVDSRYLNFLWSAGLVLFAGVAGFAAGETAGFLARDLGWGRGMATAAASATAYLLTIIVVPLGREGIRGAVRLARELVTRGRRLRGEQN